MSNRQEVTELDESIAAICEELEEHYDGYWVRKYEGTCEEWVDGFIHCADEGVHHNWGVVWGIHSVQPSLVREKLTRYWHEHHEEEAAAREQSYPQWRGARRLWRLYSDADPSASRFSRLRGILMWWWRLVVLTGVARAIARKTDAGLTAKVQVSTPLLDRLLALQRKIERPGRGWEGVETGQIEYRYALLRRSFLRLRKDWVEAKLRVAMDEVEREMAV